MTKFCKIIALVLIFSTLFMLVGCEKKPSVNAFKIYYLNIDATACEPLEYEFKSKDASTDERIDELLDALATDPKESDLRQTIPNEVSVLGHTENGYTCTIDFSSGYNKMTAAQEVLMRASVVRTLAQIEDIVYVSFTIESAPLLGSDGNPIGSMNAENFVENPGAQINSSVKETLTLYFSNKEGTSLKQETRVVHYSSNISLEKLVVEQIIEGPKGENYMATWPTSTKIINVSVADGICYVNLDSSFKNSLNNELSEDVVLYSLVDSLTALDSVEKVQISVNGENDGTLLYNYNLSDMYEFNEKIIEDDSSNQTDSTESTQTTENTETRK